MDVAQLGIEVRSERAKRAAADLDQLAGSAKRAEAATNSLGKASGAAGSAVEAAALGGAKALGVEAAAARSAANAITVHERAANQNVKRMGGSMSGLAAQFQDIGVTAAMGMNPAIIALQQGAQIAGQMEMAMQGGGSAVGVLGEAVRSLFSPLTFITILLTALAAAGLQLVDWTALAAGGLRMLADGLTVVAPYATAAAAALALIYAPAIIAGLVSVIALIARTGIAATVAGAQMAAAWLIGLGPIGALIAGIALIGAAAYALRDVIREAVGIDVVGVFKTAGNFIVNSFEAAFADVAFVWNNLPTILDSAARGAGNALVEGIEGAINILIPKIKDFYRILNPIAGLADLVGGGVGDVFGSGSIPDSVQFGRLENASAGALGAASKKHAAEIDHIMSQDRMGQFGQWISDGADAASGKLMELAGALETVDEKSKKGGSSEKFSDLQVQAENSVRALEAERSAIGLTAFEADRLAFELDLLNEARSRGISLSPAQRQWIADTASDFAKLSQAVRSTRLEHDLLYEQQQLARTPMDQTIADTMRGAGLDVDFGSPLADLIRFNESLRTTRGLLEGIASDITNGIKDALADGKIEWAELGEIALSVLERIADELIKMATDALISWFMKSIVGSFGSSLGGNVFPAAPGGGLYADGAAFNGGGVIPFAKGSAFTNSVIDSPTLFPMAQGKTGLMGEAGPEAIMPLRRSGAGLGVEAVDGSVLPLTRLATGRLGVDLSGTMGAGMRFASGGAFSKGAVIPTRRPDFANSNLPAPANQNAGITVKIENYGTSKEFEVQQISPAEVRIIARDEAANVVRGYDRHRQKLSQAG